MATISDIYSDIIDAIADDEVLSVKLTSKSKAAIFRLYSYVIATVLYLQRQLFTTHKTSVNESLDKRLTHNCKWYSDMAKAFQYGDALVDDEDYYEEEDEDKQIVSNASVEDDENGGVIMKIAKTSDDTLVPLDDDELTAFDSYINTIKDAGVDITMVNEVGDNIQITADIWYDPLVLDADGVLLDDGSTKPAEDVINDFIKDLKFNGEFIIAELATELQEAEGINFVTIKSVMTQYQSNSWVQVDGKETAFSGYYNVDTLILTYRANV